MKASSITSITLARTAPAEYRVTYWNDGIARFDGVTGPRQGAWHASVDERWFAWVAKIAKSVEAGFARHHDDVATLVIDGAGDRFVYEASGDDEPGPFWTLATLVDGMVQRSGWVPIDGAGEEDFSAWASGIPVWWNVGEVSAAALADKAGVLVLAGSYGASATADALNPNYKERRTELIEDGGLVLDRDRLRLTRHIAFTSPSAAASVMLGSNMNGRRVWRNLNGVPWSELGLDG
jgi:hypothetical protein